MPAKNDDAVLQGNRIIVLRGQASLLQETGFRWAKKNPPKRVLKTIATSCRQPSWLMVDHP
ncbi:hypothetical protein C9I50_23155 [Pseudomonas prosekii]|nr:hypothetical protein C9I50_23155 [Pseudomonas prosekii]